MTSISDTFISEIDRWNADRNIVHARVTDSKYIVKLQFQKTSFKVNLSENRSDPYVVEFDGKARLPWIEELNLYCISKQGQMNPTKLINILYKQVQKMKDEDIKEPEIVQLSSLDVDTTLGFDLEKYKKTKEIDALIPTSKSQIFISNNNNNKNKTTNTNLFNQSIVGKLVTNEYMELWELSKKKHQFTIDFVDNNVYHWKIKFNTFANPKLKESLNAIQKKFSYECIEIDIHIHDTLYPNYPPVVKIIRPRLMNSLMHRISNTKMIQLDYWTPARSMSFVINKIHALLEKHAEISVDTELNDVAKYPHGAFLKIENILLDLATQVGTDHLPDIDDEKDEKYENFTKSAKPDNTNNNNNNNNNLNSRYKNTPKNTVWAAGTGYGHGGSSTWNVEAYLKSAEERDKLIQSNIGKLITELQDCENNKTDISVVYNALKHSVLISYLKTTFEGVTLLEINKHRGLYNLIFNLISNLANEHGIYLFYEKEGRSLYDMLNELNTTCVSVSKYKSMDNSDDDLIGMITNVFGMVKICYEALLTDQFAEAKKKETQEAEKITKEKEYVNKMKELRDKDIDNDNHNEYKLIGTNFHYQKQFDNDKSHAMSKDVMKRIRNEFASFNSLPIDYAAIIISRPDKDYMTAVRTLMTGPADTPYECGVFLFDTYINNNFPAGPPNVWYLNTGGVRFNPNLYAEGKVCLSILGTWGGDRGGESWHKDNSHLIQIYTSILSQILIEKPYFNEPGYETYNNSSAMATAEDYNQNIRLYTMKHAMLDLIRNPKAYQQFEDVILAHFAMKKEKVIEVCTKWTNMASASRKDDYQKTLDAIKVELNKLK